ncbi:fibrinogen-like YCDxxxxGGGW domain-containing protein [Rothia sp. P13129]|uniref:fibrinogen-like YCDxxxxGGGW domain-containing protein n=1 Tax=Rothia sp. P13129 TaxID=3402664 RepID=UPI003AD66613
MKKKTLSQALLASAATAALGLSFLTTTSAQAENTKDGSSSDKAAASCYEIKQNNSRSRSGTYWLYTPEMDAPEQFYCDQETNGGGWVLIGRGREGWTEQYAGQGDPQKLATNPDGTDAFSPIQLPSLTVDALLNGQSPSELSDGVRFRRSTNAEGTKWQELTAQRAQAKNWTWALQATANWENIKFDNPSWTDWNRFYHHSLGRIGTFNTRYNVLRFSTSKEFNWKLGFQFGPRVYGNTSPNSYLWSPNGSYAVPFTQVYLRPKLTQADLNLNAIADSGAAASQKVELPNSYSSAMKWRTSEATGTGTKSEMNTYVQAITQVGDTVFTGGDFKNVVSARGETVNQSFIAGYNVKTAELVRSFTPKLNGQVKAVEALPNGTLAVGGEFTEVNGEKVDGFVILNPVTGKIDRTYDWHIQNRLSSGVTTVKTIHAKNGYLYIGGIFTHVKGSGSSAYAYSRSAARFDLNTGSVDWKWRPNFNGTVNGISAADDNSAVYAAGYFSTLGSERTWKLAAIDYNNGTRKQDWDWRLSYNKGNHKNQGFQFDVQDAHDSVWAGGAEHLVAQYNKNDLSRRSAAITKSGGDFQDLHKSGNVVYAACHCGDWIYEGAQTHDRPWDESSNIHMERLVNAFDANTGAVLPEFNPIISGASGYGIWESFVDSTGVLWVGGDINRSAGASGVQQTVGFARYAPRDVTPPATPANLSVTTRNGQDILNWDSKTNGKTTYQVLRDDRVIATVGLGVTTYEVEHADNARYFVRSVDAAGNYSASTPVAIAGLGNGVVDPEKPEPVDPEKPEPVDPEKPEPVDPEKPEPVDPEKPEPVDPEKPEPVDPEKPEPVDPEKPEPVDPEKPEPVDPVAPVTDKVLINRGERWNVLLDPVWANNSWREVDTDVTGWYNATAPMGWNSAQLRTELNSNVFKQPTSMYTRKEIQIENPSDYVSLELNMRLDDGAIVYVNGKEVKRHNMPSGYVDALTRATAAPADWSAINNPVIIQIPASDLIEGKNVIAVETHGFTNWWARVSFDLSATLRVG